ncbi:TPA: Alpha-amylase [Trebouxia sp. C0005]
MQCLPAQLQDVPTSALASFNESVVVQVSLATQAKSKRPKQHLQLPKAQIFSIEDLPDEIITALMYQNLLHRDLCSLAQVSWRYRHLSSANTQWEALYNQAVGDVNDVTREAAVLAQSWKELFRCKTVSDRQAEPWLTPCQYELHAVLQRISSEQASSSVAGGVTFLLDGSGSVSQEDFSAMTGFVSKAVTAMLALVPACKVGVMQFSNDVHIHIPLETQDKDNFDKAMADMVRMNGGTNIALAILTASEHMQSSLAVGAPRTMILLTDGRIDHHQGQEAVQVTRNMAEEQGNVSIYSFGVGSGVDRAELDKIVAASGSSDVDCRYMALAVHPESLW